MYTILNNYEFVSNKRGIFYINKLIILSGTLLSRELGLSCYIGQLGLFAMHEGVDLRT